MRGIIHTPDGNEGMVHLALSDSQFTNKHFSGAGITLIPPSDYYTSSFERRFKPFPKKEKGQGVLFNAERFPPKIGGLGSDVGKGHLVGPLLGIASNISNERWREPISANNTSMSADSHRLFTRAKEKGAIKGNPRKFPHPVDEMRELPTQIVSDYFDHKETIQRGDERSFHRLDVNPGRELTQDEINKGSETIRNIFRDRRPKPDKKTKKPKAKQLKFEGM